MAKRGKDDKISIRIDDQLLLETIVLADTEVIFASINSQREYLGKWLPFVKATKTVQDSRNFVIRAVAAGILSQEYVFKISYGNEFAGLIGFGNTPNNRKSVEIGYWLSKDIRHKGIITRSVEELCQYAFEKLSFPEVIIKCAVGNIESRKIPERLGFEHIKTEVLALQLSDGTFTDLIVYSLKYQNFKR